jgi:hypothetical protein
VDQAIMAEALNQLDSVMKQLQKDDPEAAAQMQAQLNQAMGGYSGGMETAFEDAVADLADHYMTFEVHFPGSIAESNATESSGSVATWKYPLSEFQNAPPRMKATIDR